MRSSRDPMSAGPAGRRHPIADGAHGQARNVSEPVQPSHCDGHESNVIPFPTARSQPRTARVSWEAFIRIEEALAHSDRCLAEADALIAEILGFPVERPDVFESCSTEEREVV